MGNITPTILGVVGSPRKNGNTHALVEQVLAGAQDAGATTEIAFLDGLEIRECDGCHACWKNGSCVKDDDMQALYLQIINADALVLGTPVYWYGPTALMKGFIDRFVFFNCDANRPGIRGKKAAVVVPFEELNRETVAPVLAFFEMSLQYLEIDLIGKICAPGMARKGEVKENPEIMAEAWQLGQKLAA